MSNIDLNIDEFQFFEIVVYYLVPLKKFVSIKFT